MVVHCVLWCVYSDVRFVLLPDRGLWFNHSLQVSDHFELLPTERCGKKQFNMQRKCVRFRIGLRPNVICLIEVTSKDGFSQ